MSRAYHSEDPTMQLWNIEVSSQYWLVFNLVRLKIYWYWSQRPACAFTQSEYCGRHQSTEWDRLLQSSYTYTLCKDTTTTEGKLQCDSSRSLHRQGHYCGWLRNWWSCDLQAGRTCSTPNPTPWGYVNILSSWSNFYTRILGEMVQTLVHAIFGIYCLAEPKTGSQTHWQQLLSCDRDIRAVWWMQHSYLEGKRPEESIHYCRTGWSNN
jgi:hypothetical protein